MKQIVTILLALVLLCGCTDPAVQTTVPAESTVPTAEPIARLEPLAPPEERGSSLIDYDPNREVYFLFHHSNYSIYMDDSWVPYFDIFILSKKPIDLKTVKVVLPIESSYSIGWKREIKMEGVSPHAQLEDVTLDEQNQFPLRVFLVYKGFDFEKLALLKETNQAAYGEMLAELTELTREFNALPKNALPEFYVYHLQIHFDYNNVKYESFQEVDIKIGSKVYHEKIGLVDLKSTVSNFMNYDYDIYGENVDDGVCGCTNSPTLYNDGLFRSMLYFISHVDVEKTVTGIRLLNRNIEFLGAYIRHYKADGTGMEYFWNGTDPLYFYPGDSVTIDAVLKLKYGNVLDMTAKVWALLDYECEYGSVSKISEAHISTNTTGNFYEMCAIVFDGIDMEGYYRHYYYPESPQERWREDFKEG